MDGNSILEMSSDIDEIEKEKAIESIVLETSCADSYQDNFEEPDELISVNSSANVTNSLYDTDESIKSTDAENGNETTEMIEKELDPLDIEHSSSIASEPCAQSTPCTQSTPIASPTQVANSILDCVVSTTTTATTTPPEIVATQPKKIVFVTVIPRPSIDATQQPQPPPTPVTISNTKQKYDKSFEKTTETRKISPLRLSIDEATTSSVSNSGTTKPIGHTVNLLNNNRILIKSVKNNHTNIPAVAATKNTFNAGPAILPPTQTKDKNDARRHSNETNETTSEKTVNVTKDEETDQTNEKETKCADNTNDKQMNENELKVKTEEVLNANVSVQHGDVDDNNDNDIKPREHINADEYTAQKFKREFEQLQKTVNESKVLSEFIIGHTKRNRRQTKSGKSKHKYNNSVEVNNSPIDEKIGIAMINRSASPSSSSVRSASKESDRSASSSFASSAAKRNTRSMNTDFSAKQKQFLKGIQQITRGTDDETDNNSGVGDDDDDDIDYYTAKQQPNITERRKSVMVKQTYISDVKVSTKETT